MACTHSVSVSAVKLYCRATRASSTFISTIARLAPMQYLSRHAV
jgi:hypothetical protein